tara:strand:+ start:1859 stop:3040 length:1182 start_codon:yes stop_codon:yes gene_type:complete
MPRISLWKDGAHTNDYRFFDRRIKEMFTTGGTGINVHKYLGIQNQGQSNDPSQPNYIEPDPLGIQDFLFLENRDRKYEQDIYTLRGIYSVTDTDFDLSQFGLFLANDTLFITLHENDMLNNLGRKLMPGDVIELPHLTDFSALDESVELSLKRYYVVQEGSRPSEGFSPTWWSHLWRIKCGPLVDAQEYKDILDLVQQDKDGNDTTNTLRDLLSTYNKELEISNKVVQAAEVEVPESGYKTDQFYVVPTGPDGTPLESKGINADDTNYNADNTNASADTRRITPQNANSYSGYLVGDGLPPNGENVTMGTSFPSDSQEGDFVLRLDFLPNRLFRYSGSRWIKVEDDVRSKLTPGTGNTQRDGFINNTATFTADDNTTATSRQSLSDALKPRED